MGEDFAGMDPINLYILSGYYWCEEIQLLTNVQFVRAERISIGSVLFSFRDSFLVLFVFTSIIFIIISFLFFLNNNYRFYFIKIFLNNHYHFYFVLVF